MGISSVCASNGMAIDLSMERPLVSLGFPVYNSKQTVQSALLSLINQTYSNFEIIISDNASDDGTGEICSYYASRDKRIRYIRQDKNIGASENFKFVLDVAQGPYFMWAAADDVRSEDFLETNITFLNENSDFVASTSPNCYEGQETIKSHLITFAIEAKTQDERFLQFFQNCWRSHAIYYSLMRTNIAKTCPIVGESFIAADWAFNLFLLLHGKIHRSEKGLTVLGVRGASSRPGAYRRFRNQPIEIFLPFYRLTVYSLRLSNGFPTKSRFLLLWVLIKLNCAAVFDQCHSNLYQFYRRLRGVIRRSAEVEK